MILAVDTETTGIDFWHGARPFFVTMCDGEKFWHYEWDVDPLTREVQVDTDQVHEIIAHLEAADQLVLHNSKFDAHALRHLWEDCGIEYEWPWDKTEDTLPKSHILHSKSSHNLTDLCVQYLRKNIQPYEDRLEKAVKDARRYCQHNLKDWARAKEGRPDMPSAKGNKKEDDGQGKLWKMDSWLPRVLAQHQQLPPNHLWWTVLQHYGNADSVHTWALNSQALDPILRRRKLVALHNIQLQLLPITHEMETRGVTVIGANLEELTEDYGKKSATKRAEMVDIARKHYSYDVTLPKNGSNESLRAFVFDVMKLDKVKNPKAKTDAPTLDTKNALSYYLATLPEGPAREFIVRLADIRTLDTALTYMASYRRFWIELPGCPGVYVLHPNLNMTGTDTLRWSSKNPNSQNISDKENFSLRYCFGPAPGWEWWKMDAKNIERRFPAYFAPEPAVIELLEQPHKPPYFGSEHLLVCHILFPQEFDECIRTGKDFKSEHKAKYKRVKNFDFAVQYGAVNKADGTGTADRTIGIPGAHSKLEARFANQTALNNRLVALARKQGYVETVPDKNVDPTKGYPLMVSRNSYGGILETTPLNYWGQGSACYWMRKAMIRTHGRIKEWRLKGFDSYITLQVHDELVFVMPKSKVHPKEDIGKPRLRQRSNLWRAKELARLMEMGGEDLGLPTPVSIEYCEHNYADGEKFE